MVCSCASVWSNRFNWQSVNLVLWYNSMNFGHNVECFKTQTGRVWQRILCAERLFLILLRTISIFLSIVFVGSLQSFPNCSVFKNSQTFFCMFLSIKYNYTFSLALLHNNNVFFLGKILNSLFILIQYSTKYCYIFHISITQFHFDSTNIFLKNMQYTF